MKNDLLYPLLLKTGGGRGEVSSFPFIENHPLKIACIEFKGANGKILVKLHA